MFESGPVFIGQHSLSQSPAAKQVLSGENSIRLQELARARCPGADAGAQVRSGELEDMESVGLRACLCTCRFWMVVKEDGHMVTARQEPRLVLVSITSKDRSLVLQAPGMDPLVLPCKLPSSNKLLDCRCMGPGLMRVGARGVREEGYAVGSGCRGAV